MPIRECWCCYACEGLVFLLVVGNHRNRFSNSRSIYAPLGGNLLVFAFKRSVFSKSIRDQILII